MGPLPLSLPATRLLVAFLLSFTIVYFYAQSHFYRDPGSAFFDQDRAYEKRYSALRLQVVEHAHHAVEVESYRGSRPAVSKADNITSPELCVSMTTVRRDGLERQYVEEAILSTLHGLTAQERSSIHLSILFTDIEPSLHPSWHQPWLRSMADDVWSYHSPDTTITAGNLTWLNNQTLTGNLPTKAIMDYSLALERCLTRITSPYIAVFEGDILLTPGWVAPTLRALRSADSLMMQSSRSGLSALFGASDSHESRDWMDMRLFNQERSTGWGSRRIGGNNELTITIGIDVALVLFVLTFRRRNLFLQRTIDYHVLALLCLVIVPISIITFFQCGKASLLPPQPGLRIQNFGCCSQALVFNRRHVAGLVQNLRDMAIGEANGEFEHVGYDMRTRDYGFDNDLDRLALYPVMAQHLGAMSAVGTTKSEAKSVWSMAFEDLRAAEVEGRHEVAMREVFGHDWETREEMET